MARRIPDVVDGATPWRVSWTCASGHFKLTASATSGPLVHEPCTAERRTVAVTKANGKLRIAFDGPWTLRIQRKVDRGLRQSTPPSVGGAGAEWVVAGALRGVDQVGEGRVTIHRLQTGRYLMRLDNYYITPNTGLELRLSRRSAPHTTREYHPSSAAFVHELTASAGSLSLMLPAGFDPHRYRSLVVWCRPLVSVYAVAILTPMS